VRPTYVATEPWRDGSKALALAAEGATRRARFVALGSPEVSGARVASASALPARARAAYDAFYVVAYAVHAATDPHNPDIATLPFDGAGLARRLRRLSPPGIPVAVGPDGIFDARAILRAGGSIDLAGLASALDFDPQTGAAAVDLPFQCVGPPGIEGGEGVVPCGVRYETGADHLVGSLPQP
jgi:hypothetical protein